MLKTTADMTNFKINDQGKKRKWSCSKGKNSNIQSLRYYILDMYNLCI